ncbi:WD40 repeat-like protein, partial [Exidia glandulosa HHB12029]
AFSLNGRRIATAGRDGYLRIFDVENSTLLASTMQLAIPSITAIALSPGIDLVACGSDDNMVRVWHVATGAVFAVPLDGDDSIVTLAFSPDGSQIACG